MPYRPLIAIAALFASGGFLFLSGTVISQSYDLRAVTEPGGKRLRYPAAAAEVIDRAQQAGCPAEIVERLKADPEWWLSQDQFQLNLSRSMVRLGFAWGISTAVSAIVFAIVGVVLLVRGKRIVAT